MSNLEWKGLILLVNDRLYQQPYLWKGLEKDYQVIVAQGAEECLELLGTAPVDLVVLESPNLDPELCTAIREQHPAIGVWIVGEHSDRYFEGKGYLNSLTKSQIDRFMQLLLTKAGTAGLAAASSEVQGYFLAAGDDATSQNKKAPDKAALEQWWGGFVTVNNLMRQQVELARRAATTDVTVMITGESGTGKEVIAHAIHFNSPSRNKPFVAINSAAMPENLIETELFGYEKGAFTGATARRIGKLEYAGGGTVFLDEIGDMPLATQAKLLRVLQERTFERVGGTSPIPFQARIISATNKNLLQTIEHQTFRDDLYYRLSVLHVHLLPLRERREDLPFLLHILLQRQAEAYHKPIKGFATNAYKALLEYNWPGNVRELGSVLQRAVLLCDDERLELQHLPTNFQNWPQLMIKPRIGQQSLEDMVREAAGLLEKEIISQTLRQVNGNRTRCAALLGIDRRTLYRKLNQYNLQGTAD